MNIMNEELNRLEKIFTQTYETIIKQPKLFLTSISIDIVCCLTVFIFL